jgi:hypothetical protein
MGRQELSFDDLSNFADNLGHQCSYETTKFLLRHMTSRLVGSSPVVVLNHDTIENFNISVSFARNIIHANMCIMVLKSQCVAVLFNAWKSVFSSGQSSLLLWGETAGDVDLIENFLQKLIKFRLNGEVSEETAKNMVQNIAKKVLGFTKHSATTHKEFDAIMLVEILLVKAVVGDDEQQPSNIQEDIVQQLPSLDATSSDLYVLFCCWLLCQYAMAYICQLVVEQRTLPPWAQISIIFQRSNWAKSIFFTIFASQRGDDVNIDLIPDLGKSINYAPGGYIAGIIGRIDLILLSKTAISKYSGAYLKRKSKAFDAVPYVPFRKLFKMSRVLAVIVGKRVYISGTRLQDIKSGKMSKYVLNAIGVALCTAKTYFVVDISKNISYTWTDTDISQYESVPMQNNMQQQHWMEATDKLWKSSGMYWDPVRICFHALSK